MYPLKHSVVFMKLEILNPLKLLVFGVYFFGCLIRCADLRGKDPKVFTFKYNCNEDRDLNDNIYFREIYDGQLDFTFEESMPEDFSCTVFIVDANGFDRDRLSFYFTEFDMGDNCGPEETWLTIADSGWNLTIDSKPIPGLPSRLCGRTFADVGDNNKQFTTESAYLRIEYHANNPAVGSGFSLIIQHFSDPPCEKWQHRCDNGRCIDKSQTCSAINPCGDHSDCPDWITTGGIMGIVIGCTVAIGVAVLLFKYLPKYLKRRNDDDDEVDDDDDRDAQTGTNRQMAEFSRLHCSASPSDGRDITSSNGAKHQRYSPLGDSEVKPNHHSDNNINKDTEDYMPRPPPPSYDIAMNNDMYQSSGTREQQLGL